MDSNGHEFRLAKKIFLFWLNELVPAFTNFNAAFTAAGPNHGWPTGLLMVDGLMDSVNKGPEGSLGSVRGWVAGASPAELL